MMEQPVYRVDIEVFQGPLDLLLHLIEQQELDITTISLAQVTDQYLAYLRVIHDRHPDDLAAFLVIAARLLLIKSRALLPRPPSTGAEQEEDVGEDLVRQLREYRRFRQVAAVLRKRHQEGLSSHLRTVPTSKVLNLTPRLDLEGTSLDDLIEALRAMLVGEFGDSDELSVTPYRVTIGQQIERISGLLASRREATFLDLLPQNSSRLETIVTLLAVLEMIRAGRIAVRQESLFGTIAIVALEKGNQPAPIEA